MIMEMNIGMHVNYKKYWNTRIGEIFKKQQINPFYQQITAFQTKRLGC